jgi:hypothetical protein
MGATNTFSFGHRQSKLVAQKHGKEVSKEISMKSMVGMVVIMMHTKPTKGTICIPCETKTTICQLI